MRARELAARCALCLAALVAIEFAWPWVSRPFGASVRALGAVLYDWGDEARRVAFEAWSEAGDAADSRILVGERRPGGQFVSLRFDSRGLAFAPLALLVALVVAAPLGFRTRSEAFAIGVLGIGAFVAARLGILVHAAGALLLGGGAGLHASVRRSTEWLAMDPTTGAFVTLAVWAFAARIASRRAPSPASVVPAVTAARR